MAQPSAGSGGKADGLFRYGGKNIFMHSYKDIFMHFFTKKKNIFIDGFVPNAYMGTRSRNKRFYKLPYLVVF